MTKILSPGPYPRPLPLTVMVREGGVFLITKVVDVPKKGSYIVLPKEAPPSPIFETFMSVVPRER